MKKLTTLILLFLSPFAVAQDEPLLSIDGYKCIVTDTKELSDNGNLEQSDFTVMYLNKEFVVDKGTGRITGGLSNHAGLAQPVVLDFGSSEQSYKALTIYKPYTTVKYLYIQEFNKTPAKPFLFIESGHIFSGTCEPY
jgi:hypothetical protein